MVADELEDGISQRLKKRKTMTEIMNQDFKEPTI